MQKRYSIFRMGCILLLLFGMVGQVGIRAKIAQADPSPQGQPPGPTDELRFVFLVNYSQNATLFPPPGAGKNDFHLSAVRSAVDYIISFYCDFLVPVYDGYNHVNRPVTGQTLTVPQVGISVIYFNGSVSVSSFMRNGQPGATQWIEPSTYCGNADGTYPPRPPLGIDATNWTTTTLSHGHCKEIFGDPCSKDASNYVDTLKAVEGLLAGDENETVANSNRQVGLIYLADGFPCGQGLGGCAGTGQDQVTAQAHITQFQQELNRLGTIPRLGQLRPYLLALSPVFSQANWEFAPTVMTRDVSGPNHLDAAVLNGQRLQPTLIGVVNELLTDLLSQQVSIYGNVITIAQAGSNLVNPPQLPQQSHISNLGKYQADPLRQFLKIFTGFSLPQNQYALDIADPTSTKYYAQTPNAPLCKNRLRDSVGECWNFPYPVAGSWGIQARPVYVSNQFTCNNSQTPNLMCNDTIYLAVVPLAFRLSVQDPTAGTVQTLPSAVYEFDEIKIDVTIDVVPGYGDPPSEHLSSVTIQVRDRNCESGNCTSPVLSRVGPRSYSGTLYPFNISRTINPMSHNIGLKFLEGDSSVDMPVAPLAIDVYALNPQLDCTLAISVGDGNTFQIRITLQPPISISDPPKPPNPQITWQPTWNGGQVQQSEPEDGDGNSLIYIFSGEVADSTVSTFSVNPIMPDGSPGPQITPPTCQINAE